LREIPEPVRAFGGEDVGDPAQGVMRVGSGHTHVCMIII
jgi:hypothetical protein